MEETKTISDEEIVISVKNKLAELIEEEKTANHNLVRIQDRIKAAELYIKLSENEFKKEDASQ